MGLANDICLNHHIVLLCFADLAGDRGAGRSVGGYVCQCAVFNIPGYAQILVVYL